MNVPDAIAVQTATPSPAIPIERKTAIVRPRSLIATKSGQRDEGKERPPGELGRRVDGELALQPAGGRPRNRRRDDVQLPPAPGASCLALGNQLFLRSTGFVSEPTLSISIVTSSPSAR